jgi:mRNA interferase YafQ
VTVGPPVKLLASLSADCYAHASRLRRDYQREKSGRHGKRLDTDPLATVTLLAKDEPLPRRYFDHPLGGGWNDHRDRHITPVLILITGSQTKQAWRLARLGSHCELGL